MLKNEITCSTIGRFVVADNANISESLRDPVVMDHDPYSETTLLNPYPFHEALREAGPVVRLSKYDVYAVGRYDEVKTIMSDFGRFSSVAGIGLVDRRDPETEKFRITSPMTEEDPPLHTHTRSGVHKLLSPILVRSWRERFEHAADGLCDTILAKNKAVNGVKEIAEEFILSVFPSSLGLDVPKEYLPALGEMNFFSLGPQNELQRQSYERVKHAIDWYDQAVKRENVKPGTFGDLVYKAEDDGVFRAGVGIGIVRSFLRGGTDTTVAGISSTLMHLAKNPKQWDILKSDPSKARFAFEEAIRLESPAQALYRLVVRDMDFQGYRLKANAKIAFFPGAANRDPRRWDAPDKFDISRDVVGNHLAFGAGHHVCVGQTIARLEAETLLQAILRRVDRLELLSEPTWRAVSAFRSLKDLPLRLIAA